MSEYSYVLAIGAEAEYRLQIVNEVHGPDTRCFLQRAGIKRGMRVADIGCGVGILSELISEFVGPTGSVVGVDASAAQIEQAEDRARRAGINNVRYVTADAASTGLEPSTFDMAYSRFLLMHVTNPFTVLMEMHSLLKPGGTLAVEDGDFTSPFCWPSDASYEKCFEYYRRIGESRGADFKIGQQLYKLFLQAGLEDPHVRIVQPCIASGDAKRLPEWTLEETAVNLIESGIAGRAEIDRILSRLQELAEDRSVLFGMARMTQAWGNKPFVRG